MWQCIQRKWIRIIQYDLASADNFDSQPFSSIQPQLYSGEIGSEPQLITLLSIILRLLFTFMRTIKQFRWNFS